MTHTSDSKGVHPALERLEELSEKAYPAPWYSFEHGWDKTSIYGELQDAPICTAKLYEDVVTEDNQEEMEAIQAAQVALIVESRNALPVLVECLKMALEYPDFAGTGTAKAIEAKLDTLNKGDL